MSGNAERPLTVSEVALLLPTPPECSFERLSSAHLQPKQQDGDPERSPAATSKEHAALEPRKLQLFYEACRGRVITVATDPGEQRDFVSAFLELSPRSRECFQDKAIQMHTGVLLTHNDRLGREKRATTHAPVLRLSKYTLLEGSPGIAVSATAASASVDESLVLKNKSKAPLDWYIDVRGLTTMPNPNQTADEETVEEADGDPGHWVSPDKSIMISAHPQSGRLKRRESVEVQLRVSALRPGRLRHVLRLRTRTVAGEASGGGSGAVGGGREELWYSVAVDTQAHPAVHGLALDAYPYLTDAGCSVPAPLVWLHRHLLHAPHHHAAHDPDAPDAHHHQHQHHQLSPERTRALLRHLSVHRAVPEGTPASAVLAVLWRWLQELPTPLLSFSPPPPPQPDDLPDKAVRGLVRWLVAVLRRCMAMTPSPLPGYTTHSLAVQLAVATHERKADDDVVDWWEHRLLDDPDL